MYAIYDTKTGKVDLSETFKKKDEAKVLRNTKNMIEHGNAYNNTKTLENGNIIYPNRYGARFKVVRTDKHFRGASYKA